LITISALLNLKVVIKIILEFGLRG